jgi:hypothetical protein
MKNAHQQIFIAFVVLIIINLVSLSDPWTYILVFYFSAIFSTIFFIGNLTLYFQLPKKERLARRKVYFILNNVMGLIILIDIIGVYCNWWYIIGLK